MSLEAQSVLVLSTSHLPEEVMDRLGEDGDLRQRHLIAPYEYGAFVWVPTDWSNVILPPELVWVLRLAAGVGVEWVRFDADGPVFDASDVSLPTWEW